jgi:hypothetical protein
MEFDMAKTQFERDFGALMENRSRYGELELAIRALPVVRVVERRTPY